MKFRLATISIVALLLLQYGCADHTRELWGKQPEPSYREKIDQFMISPEDSRLIIIGNTIIGNRYHYIFEKDSAPLSILSWSGRKYLRADFSSAFNIYSDNSITGEYSLDCSCESASSEDIQWLESNGFKLHENGQYRKTLQVNGTRYRAGSNKIANSQNFNHEYYITIKRPHPTRSKISRIALTPIAVAFDGIATIGMLPLLIFAAPFMAAGQ